MREFRDKSDIDVTVATLSGRNDFSGVIEGSAYGARLVRYRKAKEEMERNNGTFYWDFEGIKKDFETFDKSVRSWPAKERWAAHLITSVYLGEVNGVFKEKNKRLKVIWYAEGGDPMGQLENIVSQIDFEKLCVCSVEEIDD